MGVENFNTAGTANKRDEWLAGFGDFLVISLPVAVFGIMFGAASSAAGHSIAMSLWASLSIFGGASQFVFLEVYGLGVPAWSVVLAVFAVNFRHLLYSAAVADKIRYFGIAEKFFAFFLLTDLQFAVAENRANGGANKRLVTAAYYFGFGIPCYVLWAVGTLLGAVFGALVTDPALVGLDFVLPIYFLSILMGFRKRARFIPIVITSGLVAVLVERTIGAPWHISLGALAGIAVSVLLSVKDVGESHQDLNPKEGSNG